MIQKYIILVSIVLVLAILGSSCAMLGLEEEEDTTEVAKGSLADLEGTWVSSCTNQTVISVTFSGTTHTAQTRQFSDSSCSVARFNSDLEIASLTAGPATTLSDGTSGYSFSGKTSLQTVTPKSSSAVRDLIADSYCGETSWQLDTATSVAGKTCGSATFSSNDSDYADKYKISESTLTLDNFQTTFTKQ
jgi:hypothetical protein